MMGFFIILVVMIGGLSTGTAVFIGSMFWTGKWTLPGTEQRRLQAAKVDAKIAETQAQALESQIQVDRLQHARELQRYAHDDQLDQILHQRMQKALEAPKE